MQIKEKLLRDRKRFNKYIETVEKHGHYSRLTEWDSKIEYIDTLLKFLNQS